MNPSSVNGGLGHSGVKPGMIASSSDSPVPVNNVSGTSGPRKPSKKILIAVVVVAVILVVAIVVVMMMPTGNKAPASNPTIDDNSVDNGDSSDSSNSDSSSDADVDVSTSDYEYHGKNKEFYQYGNYILNGKKNVTEGLDLGKYSAKVEYAIVKAVKNNSVQSMNQAVTLWKAFYEKLNVNEISDAIKLQNNLMEFLEKYAVMNARVEDEMWKLYREVGIDSAVKMIKNDYAALAGLSYEAGAKWAGLKSAWAEQALRLYAGYDSFGCIKDGDFDQDCINKNKDALKDLMVGLKNAKAAVDENKFSMEDFASEAAKNCFEIRDELGAAETKKEGADE